jgi:SusD/RagB-like outer membrane lipoprotein
MKRSSKSVYAAALAGLLTFSAGCEDFLDVNTNPNGPETVSANLYLAPMLHWLVTGPQFDGRFIGRYTQQWVLPGTTLGTWERMGYDPATDNGAQMWRDVYWSFGQNLIDMNAKATAEQRWDLLGVGLLLKAWGWQELTDVHGEIIIQEAINQNTFSFAYDTQEFAYQEVRMLLDSAIVLLQRTDGAVDQAYLARGDRIYNGDRTKWLKVAYGMLAMHLNRFSNKASYAPAEVIAAVDKSLASNADDALITYPNSNNDDTNFLGWTRNNVRTYRQALFTLNLMNGTQFDSVVDPRMARMLSPSPDGQYRGLDPNVVNFGALTTAQRPNNFFGLPDLGGATGTPGRYIFDDRARIPLMTYAQLQFVKAEAALKMGNQALAATAYRNGISAHIDFVNSRNLDNNQLPTQISATEKAAFLAAPEIVPATVTLSHIMSQKYIALWGWGHNELWMDMRRYHYTDVDPVSGTQVYRGFSIPTTLYPDNGGKVVQRIRPRYNSEYIWNVPALQAIGATALDYHTKPLWIIQP